MVNRLSHRFLDSALGASRLACFCVCLALGMYPDLLHVLDLALLVDLYSSSFILWTDDEQIYAGRRRDDRLRGLYRDYVDWCCANGVLSACPWLCVENHRRYTAWLPCKGHAVLDEHVAREDYTISVSTPKED